MTKKSTIGQLLTKNEMKNFKGGDSVSAGTGGGGIRCGYQTNTGTWVMSSDTNGDGRTRDNALADALGTAPSYLLTDQGMTNVGTPNGHWCCASCPWNQ
jgi:hypothetical protein